jgi:hypothetical protein
MKAFFNILFLTFLLMPSGRQKWAFPTRSVNSRQSEAMHISSDSSSVIRVINTSRLRRISAVIRDLSVAFNESTLQEKFLPKQKDIIIYLYDVTCTDYKISACVQYNPKDTMYRVKLNSFNQQATDMALAATLIHETMHCILLDIHKRARQKEPKAIASILNFGLEKNDSTNFFDNDFFHLMNSGHDGHHELIYRFFYPQMVLVLERFAGIHKKTFLAERTAGLMMWSGLQDTDAYRKLSDEDKRVIAATILREKGIED